MPVENYNRKYGDVIAFHVPFEGTGKVVGCATNGADVIGRGWIVEVLTSPVEFNWDSYPFTHITVFDGHVHEELSTLFNTQVGKFVVGA